MSLRDFRGAEVDFTLSLEHRAGLPEAHFNRGIVRVALDRPADAVADFTEAIRLKPGWPEAYYNRGIARERAGATRGAEVDFGKVLETASLDSPYRSAAALRRDALSRGDQGARATH